MNVYVNKGKTLENLLRVFVCVTWFFLLLLRFFSLCTTLKRRKMKETPYRRQLFTTTFD